MKKRIITIFSCLCIGLFYSLQIGAQDCDINFTIDVAITPSKCISDGQIVVTLGGEDIDNIFNAEYGISSLKEGGYSLNPQPSNIITGIPAGSYKLTVRAFCSKDDKVGRVREYDNLVVGGDYKEPEVSLNAQYSRKSYADCATGIIAVNVINGSGNFSFRIKGVLDNSSQYTSVNPDKNGNVYILPRLYLPGTYSIEAKDACGYTVVKDLILETVSGFPQFKEQSSNAIYPDTRSNTSCNTLLLKGTSVQVSLNDDFKKYFNAGMYEIGAAIAGSTPNNWEDWTDAGESSRINLDLSPNIISDIYDQYINVFIRLKGCESQQSFFSVKINKPQIELYPYFDYCDYYNQQITVSNNMNGLVCYPLKFTLTENDTNTDIVKDKEFAFSSISQNYHQLKYGISYTAKFEDNNGYVFSESIIRRPVPRDLDIIGKQYECDSYTLKFQLKNPKWECNLENVTITITNPDGSIHSLYELEKYNNILDSKPLLYGKDYVVTVNISEREEPISHTIVNESYPKTNYFLSVSTGYESKCEVNVGQLQVQSYPYNFRVGTKFTVTGPDGYGVKTAEVTSSTGSKILSMDKAYLPPGRYTLSFDDGCVSGTDVTTYDNPGLYNYRDFGYTEQLTCEGKKIFPKGRITYRALSTNTYFRLISGPDYDKKVISSNESSSFFTLSKLGTYVLGIMTESTEASCALGTITIEYSEPALSLDKDVTAAYICEGSQEGNISIKAIGGVAPYTYGLYFYTDKPEDELVKVPNIEDITTSGVAHFIYGKANEKYIVRISDNCGVSFPQEVTITDIRTQKIIYADRNPVCTGETIKLNCITLGDTDYKWILPDGSEYKGQNLVIDNAQPNMTGYYKVQVKPEFCGLVKEDIIYITVTSPLEPTQNTKDQMLELCAREPITLTADVIGGGNGINTFKWQSSSDGISWSYIVGETSASFTPPSFIRSGTYYYRRETKDACSTAYNLVTLNVKPCYILVNPNIRVRVEKK